MRFRPCIDLRNGRVVQIVGGTLTSDEKQTVTNFETDRAPSEYAELYRRDGLTGGHVIALGPGNQEAALQALRAWPGGLQMGGGITPETAGTFLDAGASHVIVTSYVFREGCLDRDRLATLKQAVGRDRLVLDLSCRRQGDRFVVVTDRWQTYTTVAVDGRTLAELAGWCAEFLVHGVDVEGKRCGIEDELVALLGAHSPIPATYAGGVRDLTDLDHIATLGGGRVDATIGSALDIFGGSLSYTDVLAWQRNQPNG